jgi:hypothetical protein
VVRYADNAVLGFQNRADAEQFLRESGQPSKFSVTGDPALDARATATQPEESDDVATTRGYRGALAAQT